MRYKAIITSFILVFSIPLALAQTGNSSKPELLEQNEEIRIALSAAPEHLRDGAGIWVLTTEGYRQIKVSENNFTCIINRDHPFNLKPTCYDAEGSRTILPKVVFFGNLLHQGVPVDEIQALVEEKFIAGEFTAPSRPGIAYMLSDEIQNYNPASGEVESFPPHLMFYAPDLTNDDVGAPSDFVPESPWLPFVAYQGEHGFMIVIVE
tara:strand:+ start:1044 stop:1664 length:621 start_codon:yes stop_codon:yes gene_type:complete